MPQQYGTASIYGVDGAVTVANAYVLPESLDSEQSVSIDEFKSGLNQLLGFYKSDERIMIDMVLSPKAETLANAKLGIAFPEGPCKITLSGFVDDGAGTRAINGDYIYVQGARKSLVRGQASFRVSAFRPLDLPAGVTIDTLVTKLVA